MENGLWIILLLQLGMMVPSIMQVGWRLYRRWHKKAACSNTSVCRWEDELVGEPCRNMFLR